MLPRDDLRLVPEPNGVGRRRFLRIGGLSVVAAAALAACGTDDDEGVAAATTTTGVESRDDVQLLRTAASIEQVAVDTYTALLERGVVTTAALADAMKRFQGHHSEHATLFRGETRKLGGKGFTGANPTLAQQLEPRLAGVRAEPDAARLALDIERIAAASFQLYTAEFETKSLRAPVMSVCGAEARHVAVLAAALNEPPYPASGLQATDAALTAAARVPA